MSRDIEYEESGGNVFADLGVPEPDEALLKSDLAIRVSEIIEERRLTQKEAAKLLHVAQPNICKLLRGELRGFSIERLMRFLVSLDQEIDVVIKPKAGPQRRHIRTVFAGRAD